ncbi:lariat debranching enzyme, C-terminal domain-containing protein [Lentinula aff. detonsa]|uniref:Lariat debranching enzyme, C-terminal domain-containing protein n=1 Tax=Lentinula aff. detonsa TaxID=2804958 RepID=A0AA38NP55_9AGAR|nr:lariat debranching enzyme, C-terminal domain-containing protein [Lentinula aff. detonsa]KAJ3795903.1 lariat debranching enzyme, C-terminal domain-containing protein [Lentinula aff. detonsa]
MKIAIEGCCHGALDTIYSSIADLEAKNNFRVDLLLICGDFQAIRNERDLQCMAVPEKYKQLGGFYKYYIGEKTAPILTLIIGGNHEASNYFWELFHGGWVAPNIYFLGYAGSVLVNGIRIAGASGIFKGYNFNKGYFERQPYSKDDLRSIYHIRESAIRQLSLLPPSSPSSSTTILLSHDWPLNITSYASPSNLNQLLRKKPYFKQEVSEGRLGSPPLMGLFQVLRPRWWFSAHLHVGFDVRVWWEDAPARDDQAEMGQARSNKAEKKVANPDEIVIDDDEIESVPAQASTLTSVLTLNSQISSSTPAPVPVATPSPPALYPKSNPDEIILDDLDGDVAFDVAVPTPPLLPASGSVYPPSESGWYTQFVALDKCLPQRKFLEVIDVDTPEFPSTPSSSTLAQPIPPPSSSSPTSSPETATSSASHPILTFDPYWLAITRAFHSNISFTHKQKPFPDEATAREMVSKELAWVKENIEGEGKLRVQDVQQFARTAPGPEIIPDGGVGGEGSRGGGRGGGERWVQPPAYSNPQTEAFCRMLMVPNFVNQGA